MVQERPPLARRAGALALTLLVGACSLPAPYEVPAMPQSVPPATPAAVAPPPPTAEAPLPLPAVREHRLSAATRSLVTQARAEQEHGDLPAASTTLDRALRLEPTNPLVWIEIGRLRLAENDARQAEHCGLKALQLAEGDRRAQSQAGRVLADALRAQHRNQEAREIESRPYMN